MPQNSIRSACWSISASPARSCDACSRRSTTAISTTVPALAGQNTTTEVVAFHIWGLLAAGMSRRRAGRRRPRGDGAEGAAAREPGRVGGVRSGGELMRIGWFVPAPFTAISGGYVYDRAIVAGLRDAGHDVDVHELAGRHPLPDDGGARGRRGRVARAAAGRAAGDRWTCPARLRPARRAVRRARRGRPDPPSDGARDRAMPRPQRDRAARASSAACCRGSRASSSPAARRRSSLRPNSA